MTTLDARLTHLIWSKEHDAWWGPRECGYYTNILVAGVYTKERAEQISAMSNGDEEAVSIESVLNRYRNWHGLERMPFTFIGAVMQGREQYHAQRSAEERGLNAEAVAEQLQEQGR